MKKKKDKSDKKDESLIIHPGTLAIAKENLYDNAAKLQRVINKFLKKEFSKKDKKYKKAKKKNKKIAVIKKAPAKKKSVLIKKSTTAKK